MVIVVKVVADTAHMDTKKKVTVSWSGGKDSAFALFKVLQSTRFEVVSLHTVISAETKRVGLHGVREALIESQAKAIGLPLQKLYLESADSHDNYQALMKNFYFECAQQKIDGVVFGDIFLEDLKLFRETLLASAGLKGIYPLWGEDSKMLATEFIQAGFKTLICSANAEYFSRAHLGGVMDGAFIRTLSPHVDPCGENGEFHTFVYDGPIFKEPLNFQQGEIIAKTYTYQKLDSSGLPEKIETTFLFQDLLP